MFITTLFKLSRARGVETNSPNPPHPRVVGIDRSRSCGVGRRAEKAKVCRVAVIQPGENSERDNAPRTQSFGVVHAVEVKSKMSGNVRSFRAV